MPEQISSLIKRAKNCKVPDDFFAGRSMETPMIPQNIICFCRTSGTFLMNSSRMAKHHHHRFVLVCVLKGIGRLNVDNNTLVLHPGDALILLPFQLHYYLRFPEENIAWFYITFETDQIARMERFRGAEIRKLGNEGLDLLGGIINSWLGKIHPTGLPLFLSLFLNYLLESAEKGTSSHARIATKDEQLLKDINRIAAEGSALSATQIARKLGMSTSLLRNRFIKLTGHTIGKHLRYIRVQQACGLLYQSSLTVSEIAEICGFNSVYAFSRAFKNIRGVSPRKYQQTIPSPTRTT